MKIKILRDKFIPARYQFSIATDMGSYLSMVNQDDPYLEWRVGWYLAWRDGRYDPKAKLRTYLRGSVKNDFMSVFKQLNLDDALVKVAECSNFASHALAILLDDPKVTDEYNICLASIGSSLNHTIAILLPKKILPLPVTKENPTLVSISKGMLIVDPWARSMGYGEDVSMVVKPRQYVYSELLEKISLSYQSVNDPTLPEKTSSEDKEVGAVGKISTKRKLKLENRLFGTTRYREPSSIIIPDDPGPTAEKK